MLLQQRLNLDQLHVHMIIILKRFQTGSGGRTLMRIPWQSAMKHGNMQKTRIQRHRTISSPESSWW